MPYYLTIPYRQAAALRYPDLCPFSRAPAPTIAWKLKGATRHRRLFSLAGVALDQAREFVLEIPVSPRFAQRQQWLEQMSAWLLVSALAGLVVSRFWQHSTLVFIALGLLVFGFSALGWRYWLRRRIWIDYVGDEFIELATTNRAYADELAQMNGLKARWNLVNLHWS